uniref:biotin/lipoyl-containing protein n=1 Tax=Crenothrix polyspora TaxID=360316 RepID=UPI00277D1299
MLIEIKVPDVGAPNVDVIEVLIQAGDTVVLDQSIATLEGDKASMELPSTATGVVQQVHIKPGDKVSEGALIATVLVAETAAVTEPAPTQAIEAPAPVTPPAIKPAEPASITPPSVLSIAHTAQAATSVTISNPAVHASP